MSRLRVPWKSAHKELTPRLGFNQTRLNGGPGCSSLEGLLQENGPFLLPFNSTDVVKNEYSWTKLANVFWVEQPVSVGLGKGKPDIKNEKELAAEFYSFLVQCEFSPAFVSRGFGEKS